MKALQGVIQILTLLIVMSMPLVSQSITLRGSSAIELNIGFWNNFNAGQQISLQGVRQEARANGFLGGLTYSYWMRENMAITVAGSLLSSEANVSVTTNPISVGQTANALFSILIGTRYYLPEPEPEDFVRPYASLAVGSFMGFEASNTIVAQSAHSESTFGGRIGVGIDAFLGSGIKVGASAGYNLMSDFRSAVGARNNYNGGDFSLGIGFLFGGKR
jgi:hypothetical protein